MRGLVSAAATILLAGSFSSLACVDVREACKADADCCSPFQCSTIDGTRECAEKCGRASETCNSDTERLCCSGFACSASGECVSTSPSPSAIHGANGECYNDEKDDRIFPQAIKGIADVTPASCKILCEADPANTYYGLQFANECWCGPDSSALDKHGLSDACTMPCSGDEDMMCGGRNAMNVYSIESSPACASDGSACSAGMTCCGGLECIDSECVPSPSPTVGANGECYNDKNGDRIFTQAIKGIADVTPASCKLLCEANSVNAYYGLQFANECWCGPDSSAIDKHGLSDACTMPCSGDGDMMCGGRNAMNVYSIGSGSSSTCGWENSACSSNTGCCRGLECVDKKCSLVLTNCSHEFEACRNDGHCCSSLTCGNNGIVDLCEI